MSTNRRRLCGVPVSVIGTFAIMYLYGFSLNNLGNVVGYSTYPDDQPGVSFSKATLYQDGVLYDLNTVTDTDNGYWILTDAVAINDAQEILVNACTEFGDCRTGLLTPVPEPRALVLLLAGLLAVGAGRW